MKKINFLKLAISALVIFGMVAFAGSTAMAASNTGDATATVLIPISVDPGTLLDFGSFDGTAGGNVTITPAGGVSGITQNPTGSASAGSITINGEPTFAYSVGIGSTATPSVLTNPGGVTMAVTYSIATPTVLDGSGSETLGVGGVLTVVAGQAAGIYSGMYKVDANY